MRRWHWCCNRPDIHRVFRRYRESSGAIQSRTRVRSAGHVAQRPIHQSQYVAGPADPVLSCRRAANWQFDVGVRPPRRRQKDWGWSAVDLGVLVLARGCRCARAGDGSIKSQPMFPARNCPGTRSHCRPRRNGSVGGDRFQRAVGHARPTGAVDYVLVPASPVLVADPPSGGCGFSSMPGDPRSTGCIHSVR